jgi:DNA repair exonuclease SbcCD ATPase subunit
MNKLIKIPFIIFMFNSSLALAQSSDWWWHTTYESDDNPPKFCVKDGVFTGPVRCMDMDKAKDLGFDARKVFGAANSPSTTTQVARAQADLSKAQANFEQRQAELKNHQDEITQLEGQLDPDRNTFTQYNTLRNRISSLKAKTQTLQSQVQDARTALDNSLKTAQPTLGKVELQSEIARKGLLIQFTALEKRLGSFEANIDAVETEFNNTALEAYVAAKLGKVADHLCEFKNSCEKNTNNKKAAKKKFMDSVVSQELQNSASGRTTAPASAPAQK